MLMPLVIADFLQVCAEPVHVHNDKMIEKC